MTSVTSVNRRQLLGAAAGAAGIAAAPLARRSASGRPLDPVLADLHRRTFAFFWETTRPDSGLAPDNWPNPLFASIAATGFALAALPVGVASGYVPRAAAAGRAMATLRTFWNGPQGDTTGGVIGHKGFFYHFLHLDNATRYGRSELSSIDTCLFLLGALTAGAFFDGPGNDEAEIRRLAVALYARVDWTFMARPNGMISMGWHPETGLPHQDERGLIERSWDRYNEGMMAPLLALGAPDYAVAPGAWDAWSATIGGTWGTNWGQTYLGFSPLFGHQYSHCWFDFRAIADPFMRAHGSDYFENSRRATLAQRAYAIANPSGFRDYGADVWGLTACRGPGDVAATVDGRARVFHGYGARGAQTGDGESFDDGTLAPTAGASSIAFAPEVAVPLIHSLRSRYGAAIYGRYGFTDAFNPSFPATAIPANGRVDPRAGWVADEHLGIDQGPILLMLENYRSGLIWDLFCRSALTGPIVRRALRRAGFLAVGAQGRWLER